MVAGWCINKDTIVPNHTDRIEFEEMWKSFFLWVEDILDSLIPKNRQKKVHRWLERQSISAQQEAAEKETLFVILYYDW